MRQTVYINCCTFIVYTLTCVLEKAYAGIKTYFYKLRNKENYASNIFCVIELFCDWLNFFVFAKMCCNAATKERCYGHNRYHLNTVTGPGGGVFEKGNAC